MGKQTIQKEKRTGNKLVWLAVFTIFASIANLLSANNATQRNSDAEKAISSNEPIGKEKDIISCNFKDKEEAKDNFVISDNQLKSPNLDPCLFIGCSSFF